MIKSSNFRWRKPILPRKINRQCLNRRILDQEALCAEIAVWQQQRSQEAICDNWRFTTEDARIRLKSLYPTIQQ